MVTPVDNYLMSDTKPEIDVETKQQSTVVWHSFSACSTAVTVFICMWQCHHPSASNKVTACLLFFCCIFPPQLEDDIIAKPDFIESIKSFAAQQSPDWMILEFSQLGFIGKY